MAETKDFDDTLIMERTDASLSANPEDAAPKRVAHYALKHEIGRGALSVVYEAEDTHTGQEVALKLLTLSSSLTSLEAEALIARFEREARTAARLSHPNIVHIHEVGAEESRHFLAMEYLKGQTLRKRLGAGTLPTAEAFAVLTQIAGALDAVHKAGIVHRDVKPTNIILLPGGTAKLLDFGIARSSKETVITHRGMVTGSPSYMAPEQIKGDAGTKATDLWALGVLSYEMLTGHLPFTGHNIGGVMFRIMHESPAAMPDLPPAVQKVLLRALDKRPSQRYATAGAFVQALKLASPKQAPAAPEQNPAASPKPAAFPKPVAFPKPAAFPKPVKPPKPAASFLPGPKWLPEAALMGLFLLGFGGAYLARLHSDSHTQKAAAGLTAARSSSQTPAQAAAPDVQAVAPDAQAAAPDDPSLPNIASASAHDVPARPASPKAQEDKAQEEPKEYQAALPRTQIPSASGSSLVQAKQAAAFVKPGYAARTAAAVPAQPRRLALKAAPAAAPRQEPIPVASVPPRVPLSPSRPESHPTPVQVASRHLPVTPAGPPPVPKAVRSEPATAQPAPPPSVTPPVPAQAAEQSATLSGTGESYDPEADARRRKSAWSQEGPASQP